MTTTTAAIAGDFRAHRPCVRSRSPCSSATPGRRATLHATWAPTVPAPGALEPRAPLGVRR